MAARLLAVLILQVCFLSTVNAQVNLQLSEHDQLPVFSADYYLRVNPDVAETFGLQNYSSARWHFYNYGRNEGRPSSPSFHVRDYLELNSDVASTFGQDYSAAFWHFEAYGISEGRKTTHAFDVRDYIRINRDWLPTEASNSYLAAHNHWIISGLNNGLKSDDRFDVIQYLELHEDLRLTFGNRSYVDAYAHWLLYGRSQGRFNGIDRTVNRCTSVPQFTNGSRLLNVVPGERGRLVLNMSDEVHSIYSSWNSFNSSNVSIYTNPYNLKQIFVELNLQLFPFVQPQTGSWFLIAANNCGSISLSGDIEILPTSQVTNSGINGFTQACSSSPQYSSGSTEIIKGESTTYTLSEEATDVEVYDNGSGVTASVNGTQLTVYAPSYSNGAWYTVYPINNCGRGSVSGGIR